MINDEKLSQKQKICNRRIGVNFLKLSNDVETERIPKNTELEFVTEQTEERKQQRYLRFYRREIKERRFDTSNRNEFGNINNCRRIR